MGTYYNGQLIANVSDTTTGGKLDFLFEEKCFPFPKQSEHLIPLNDPGQTTGVLVENASSKYPDVWRTLTELKSKQLAGEITGYERLTATQEEYDAKLQETRLLDTNGHVLKNGFCSLYVIDEENYTIRFPFKGDSFDRGYGGGEPDQTDQIRNITGKYNRHSGYGTIVNSNTSDGPFYYNPKTAWSGKSMAASDGTYSVSDLYFDASRTVPTGNENQPRSQGKYYYLVVGSTVEEVAIIDIQDEINEYVDNSVIPTIADEGEKWVDNIRGIIGTWYSSTRTNLPYGLIRANGASSEPSLYMDYTEANFPDLFECLRNGTIQSVSIEEFDSLVQQNGWCGVFGFTKAGTSDEHFYSYQLYWSKQEIPAVGDRLYNSQGQETDRTVGAISGTTITALQDGTGGTITGLTRNPAGDFVISTPIAESTYFKAPLVTNEAQQNVIPSADGSNANLGRTLVISKKATEEDASWYNLYSDGWIEQGGKHNRGSSATVNLSFRMSTLDFSLMVFCISGSPRYAYTTSRTVSSFNFGAADDDTANNDGVYTWRVWGYVDSTVYPDLNKRNTNYFIQAYNTNVEINLVDYMSGLKEELNSYADGLIHSSHNVGDIFYTNRTEKALNGAVVCDGAEYNFADFGGDTSEIKTLLDNGSLPSITSDVYLAKRFSGNYDTPTFTSNVLGDFEVSDSANSDDIYKVFNGVSSNYILPGGWVDYWIQEKFPTKVFIHWYMIQADNYSSPEHPSDWIFQGSNDGSDWVNIDIQSGQDFSLNQSRYFKVDTEVPYQYYRLLFSAGTTSGGKGELRRLVFMPKANEDLIPFFVYNPNTASFRVPTMVKRTLIRQQKPTDYNEYTWYNLYSDGWVEQGGPEVGAGYSSGTLVILPIKMQDINYNVQVSPVSAAHYIDASMYKIINEYSIRIYTGFNGTNTSSNNVSWCVKGYANPFEYTYDKWNVENVEVERPMVQLISSTTDEAVATCTSVINDVSELKSSLAGFKLKKVYSIPDNPDPNTIYFVVE